MGRPYKHLMLKDETARKWVADNLIDGVPTYRMLLNGVYRVDAMSAMERLKNSDDEAKREAGTWYLDQLDGKKTGVGWKTFLYETGSVLKKDHLGLETPESVELLESILVEAYPHLKSGDVSRAQMIRNIRLLRKDMRARQAESDEEPEE